MSTPIVVTGLGFVSPLGTGTEPVWKSWSEGTSGVRMLSDEDSRNLRGVDPVERPPVGKAGFVSGFEPGAHITSPHLRRMDWCSRMVVACATQAVADARLSLEAESEQTRTALVMGSALGNQRETEKYLTRVLRRGPKAGQPFLFPNLVLNAAAGYAAIELQIRGPNISVSEHEASGEVAIVTAVDLLRAGLCDRAIVGGVDEFGSLYLGALQERRLLAPQSLPPGSRIASNRGTLIPGEGAAALVLEREPDARSRGQTPYATISAARSGGLPAGPYAVPEAKAAAERLLELLDQEEAPPMPISTILGGSSGPGPREELDRALSDRIEAKQELVPELISINALVGNWGARGAFYAGLAALGCHRGQVPGSAPHAPQRILIPGSGRSGIVVALAIDVNENS